jgi:hypothetical protein
MDKKGENDTLHCTVSNFQLMLKLFVPKLVINAILALFVKNAILALFVKNKEILEMICDARNETWGENIHISRYNTIRFSKM